MQVLKFSLFVINLLGKSVKIKLALGLSAVILGLTACAGGPKVMIERMIEPGFLPNYNVLQVVGNIPKDIRAWRYVKPGFQLCRGHD